jgi:competence protein ComEA
VDHLPLSPSRRRVVAAAIVAVAAFAFAFKQVSAPDGPAAAGAGPIEPIAAAPPVPPERVLVHVVGAVRRPGLYELPESSRVADAVKRAGGATAKADVALVNLAAPIADGTQIVVPRRAPAVRAAAGAAPSSPPGPVHLNSATLEQLDALPGVGPVTAQKIIAYREQNGAFRSVDDLDAVPGIGPARLDELRTLVAP